MRKRRKKPKGSCGIPRAFFTAVFAASYLAAIAWVHGHFCRIEGSSMEPSYRDKDIVYTETLPEGTFPALGDVVILDMPSDGENKLSFLPWRTLITKRVVGVPGDLIEIREDGLYRNGDFIEEPYVKTWKDTEPYAIELDVGEYFVLGDNRDVSYDSRAFGPVREDSFSRIVRSIIFGSTNTRTPHTSE